MTPADARLRDARLGEAATCVPGPDGSCALCADEAIPGRVAAVHDATRTADVDCGDRVAVVALDLVDGVARGDVVLVHQGFVIGRVESGPVEAP